MENIEHWRDRALMAEALLEKLRDDVDRLEAENAALKSAPAERDRAPSPSYQKVIELYLEKYQTKRERELIDEFFGPTIIGYDVARPKPVRPKLQVLVDPLLNDVRISSGVESFTVSRYEIDRARHSPADAVALVQMVSLALGVQQNSVAEALARIGL